MKLGLAFWGAMLLITTANTGCTLGMGNHHDVHEPRHGGMVVEENFWDYELVAKPHLLQLYVRNHDVAADVSEAVARARWPSDKGPQEAELKPAGGLLQATGDFDLPANFDIEITLTMRGKSYTVNFPPHR